MSHIFGNIEDTVKFKYFDTLIEFAMKTITLNILLLSIMSSYAFGDDPKDNEKKDITISGTAGGDLLYLKKRKRGNKTTTFGTKNGKDVYLTSKKKRGKTVVYGTVDGEDVYYEVKDD